MHVPTHVQCSLCVGDRDRKKGELIGLEALLNIL